MIAATPEERSRAVAYLSGGHVDGVLLVSPHSGDPLLSQLVQAEVPIVACGRVLGHEQVISSVSADDRSGGRSAVEHLLAAGRRRIAMITGPLDTSGGVDRLQGYTDALLAHGVEVEPARIMHGDWSRESGAAAMRALLEQAPDLDAVFVASDSMAAGTLPVLRAAGRSVPDDVRVVGFDDTGLAETLDPPLSTVHHPLERIADEMVRLLTDVVAGRTPLSITVPTTLVLRQSSPAISSA